MRLGDVIAPRNDIVHPRDNPSGRDIFVGLEHIESGTGRRLGSDEIDKAAMTGRKARFRTGDVVYGYLRPYLNKVWLADFDGLCSVDQYVYVVDSQRVDAEYIALFMRSPSFLSRAPVDSGPGQLPRVRLNEIARVELDLPPLPQQKAIAAALREQLAAAARMRAAVDRQARIADGLQVAALQVEFERILAEGCGRVPLCELVDFLPARSTASAGDVIVPVATSGCLTPLTFDAGGVVPNRMWSSDLEAALLQPGEVLVARSNTADLVGQCSLYDGDPREVYAADLTIRLMTRPEVTPRYVAHFLSYLWSTGYWKERAAGASWTMKKISRRLLKPLRVPVPAEDEQKRVVDRLRRMADGGGRLSVALEERERLVGTLPTTLLRQAFSGDL